MALGIVDILCQYHDYDVILPTTAFELYTPSPENKDSINIIKAVSVSGKVTTLVLVVLGKVHMESWYHERLSGAETILLSIPPEDQEPVLDPEAQAQAEEATRNGSRSRSGSGSEESNESRVEFYL